MEERFGTQRLLALRKVTRAISDSLRDEMRDHLTTLAPLVRPRGVLGDFIEGPGRESVRGADRAWKDVETLYQAIAPKPPFSLARDLKSPFEVPGTALEMAPVEYEYRARSHGDEKAVTVVKPFQWHVTYSGHGPARLRELVADPNRDGTELQRGVVLAIILHVVLGKQPGVGRVLSGLRFPLETARTTEFGALPLTLLTASVPTVRPPDDVIIQTTEIAGTSTVQELADVEAIAALADPLRERLLAIVRTQAADLLAGG
jgi:hypothetical protein